MIRKYSLLIVEHRAYKENLEQFTEPVNINRYVHQAKTDEPSPPVSISNPSKNLDEEWLEPLNLFIILILLSGYLFLYAVLAIHIALFACYQGFQ